MTAFVERLGEGGRRGPKATPTAPDVPTWPKHDRRAGDKDSNGHRVASTTAVAERRTWAPGSGYTVIACVDVQSAEPTTVEPERNDLLWRLALRRMERCIRPGDQVCMLAGPRVAVVLGNGSHRVAPSALGTRLARALGDHLAVGATGLDLRVAIGIGAGTDEVDPASLAAAAMAPLRNTRARTGSNEQGPRSAFVAVTHVPDHQALALLGPVPLSRVGTDEACRATSRRLPRRLDRRVLISLSEDLGLAPTATLTPIGWGVMGPDHADTSLAAPGLRVMLVDPEADPDHSPRPMIEAVVSVARRCGVEAVLSPAVDTDSVVLDLLLTKPDVVVIVVQGEVPRFGAGSESHYAWDRPARLTRALREAGTPVIALSVGASAAALAVCVEQGAIGLLHTDLLSQELARQTARRLNGNGGGTQSGSGYEDLRGPGQLPAPYNSLVHLTPSERRVLFHMMEGRSAAEIAATLVVSLTTVRSHIRSILRKLNVNSQLAAVALAFGTLPDQALAE